MNSYLTEPERPFLFGDCDSCPLRPPKIVRGYGVGGGVAIVGESPGRTEVDQGRPFIGPSGRLIRAILQQCGQDPDEVYWTNSILCHSPTKPHRDAVFACNNRLHDELDSIGATKVLLLGGVALQAFLNPLRPASIVKYRGKGLRVRVGTKVLYALATYHPAAVLRQTDLFRDLAQDTAKLLDHQGPIAMQKPHVFVSWTPTQAKRRLPALMNASKISCDIETTGFSTVDDIILSTGFGVQRMDGEYESHIVPNSILTHPEVQPLILDILKEFPGRLILHNAKFDLRFEQVLYKTQIRPKQLDDTMLMSYVLDERPASPHGLKALSRYHFDAEDYSFDFDEFFARPNLSKEDYEKLFYYQGQDCMYTLMLHNLFAPEIDAEPRLRHLLDTLLYPATYAFMDIENNGILLDMTYLRQWGSELQQEADERLRDIQRLVLQGWGLKDFNPGSPQQVKKLVYQVWGVPKQLTMFSKSKQWKQEVGSSEWPTGSTVLSRIAETASAEQATILEGIRKWRQARSMLNTYVKGLIRSADTDNRVRSFFFLHGSVTGRLASTRPNLQNVPSRRGTEAERSFTTLPGWSIIAADYSQLELRVLACFSKDPQLTSVFVNGLDIHSEVGSRLFEKPVDQISVMERKLTKTMVFGVIYGRGAESIILGHEVAYMVREGGGHRWTKAEGKDFQRRLLSLYPGMSEFFSRMKRDAMDKHYVETPTGRRRRFPFITEENKPEVLRQAGNSPIQGTASDICLDGLIRLHEALPPDKAHILSMIHDAVLVECRNDVLDDTLRLIKSTMEDVRLIEPLVPFKIEMKAGPNWGEVKKIVLPPAEKVA